MYQHYQHGDLLPFSLYRVCKYGPIPYVLKFTSEFAEKANGISPAQSLYWLIFYHKWIHQEEEYKKQLNDG